MPFEIFDRSRLKLLPLSQRIHDLNLDVMMDPEANPVFSHPSVTELAARILIHPIIRITSISIRLSRYISHPMSRKNRSTGFRIWYCRS